LAFVSIDTSSHDPEPSENATAWPYILVVSMILYVAAYAVGLGCVPWQQSELFPLRVRSLGSGLATATNWTSNFVIGLTFLPMMKWAGPPATFLLYALICCVGWVVISRIYLETAGLELEEIGELLEYGWNVEKSVAEFRERRWKANDEGEGIGHREF
jgi:SP family myo-inositol transporter-like MFS transporter 13